MNDARPVGGSAPAESAGRGRRLSVTAIDQALSGGSNLLVVLLAAQVLPVASFGLFWIVILVYGLALVVGRALVGDMVLVRAREVERWTGAAVSAALLVGVLLALAVGLVAVVLTLVVSRPLGLGLVALAGCLPLLIVQDAGRYLGFATRRPALALVLDALWLVLLVGASAVVWATGLREIWQFTLAWGVSGAVAGLLALAMRRPSAGGASRAEWLRVNRADSSRLLLAYTLSQSSSLAAASAVAVLAGPRVTGGVQGALLLQRPFTLFQMAAIANGVVEVSHARHSVERVRALAVRTTLFTVAVALAVGAVILVVPDRAGRLLLADAWTEARPLLAASAAQLVGMSLMSGARAGLMGRRRIALTVRTDVTTTVFIVLVTVVGVAVWGAEGGMWAVAAGQVCCAALWWSILWRDLREARVGAPADEAPSPAHP